MINFSSSWICCCIIAYLPTIGLRILQLAAPSLWTCSILSCSLWVTSKIVKVFNLQLSPNERVIEPFIEFHDSQRYMPRLQSRCERGRCDANSSTNAPVSLLQSQQKFYYVLFYKVSSMMGVRNWWHNWNVYVCDTTQLMSLERDSSPSPSERQIQPSSLLVDG